ncbi:hypothetical protein SUBVAR_06985 [Subdoligranulum variabile DSM 15176]|uniref:Uncharacterized protein n=1 Tax=Subdoligranulum variabile DSM 15176 TaxID=411471 RepID=D1PRF5_9FIRM|nr:hypothetical protein SUBVAR_06985 [Subdoligranulum variabile DSM 15176]
MYPARIRQDQQIVPSSNCFFPPAVEQFLPQISQITGALEKNPMFIPPFLIYILSRKGN